MESHILQITIVPALSEDIAATWIGKWNSWPTGHLFNHPKWFRIVKEAFPNRRILLIQGRMGERDLIFMTAEESDGGGLQLAGTPYLDKGSLLWDPELSAGAWQQFVSLLLERYHWLRFQELSFDGPWKPGEGPQRTLSMVRHASDSPCFDVSSPQLSSKQRHELRRYTNLLRQQGPLRISFRRLTRGDIETMRAIEGQSVKIDRRTGVLFDVEYIRWLESLVSQFEGDCWIGLMTLHEQPIAHYMAISCKESFLGIHMAFIKRYAHFSPGNVLIFNILAQLSERGIKRFDYGRGPSAAKAKFARDLRVSQHDFYYFRNSWAGRSAQLQATVFWWLVAMRRVLRRYASRRINSVVDRLGIRR